MFAVDNILISEDLVDASFCCNLGACQGACCVEGTSGAPLEPEERAELERVLPIVEHRLRRQARKVIRDHGVWEEIAPDQYATTCVGDAECVFVTYDGSVASCAIQRAHEAGETDFPKPISCHLYPVRVQDLGDHEALNYEQMEICRTATRHGRRNSIRLVDFLETPLTRRYGADWYTRFRDACEERLTLRTTVY